MSPARCTGAGRPFAGALVVLAPRVDTGNPDDSRGFVTDSDGSFEYPAVRPGDYAIFAVEGGAQLEYKNRAAIQRAIEAARPLRVEPRASQEIRLDLPEPPKR